jgi:hypothetical protein
MTTRAPMTPGQVADAVENGLGIGSCQEDGPLNHLLCVRLEDEKDFREWTRTIYMDSPAPEAPPRYPALAVWFTYSNRGPYKVMHYLYVLDMNATYED